MFKILASMTLLAAAMTSQAYAAQMPQCEAMAATSLQKHFPEAKEIQSVDCRMQKELDSETGFALKICTIHVKDNAKFYEVVMPKYVLINAEGSGFVCDDPTYYHIKTPKIASSN